MATANSTRSAIGKSTKPHTPEPPKPRPVHEIRLGRTKAAIWANESENGIWHNVTLSRIYVDDSGQWQRSDSFGRDDLYIVAHVAQLAAEWIYTTGNSVNNGQHESTEEIPY